MRHLTRVGAAVAVTAVLVGSSAQATTSTPLVSHHIGARPVTAVPGHDSSEWLMMGLHCGASLT
jgi:hypothetical protein